MRLSLRISFSEVQKRGQYIAIVNALVYPTAKVKSFIWCSLVTFELLWGEKVLDNLVSPEPSLLNPQIGIGI